MKKILLSSLMLITTSAFAHALPEYSKWVSDYTPGKGIYSVKVVSNDAVELTVDENNCGFNQLGKVSFCTKMFYFPIKGALVPLAISAPKSITKYSIENREYRIVHDIKENGYIRLLKEDENDVIIESVRLFKN